MSLSTAGKIAIVVHFKRWSHRRLSAPPGPQESSSFLHLLRSFTDIDINSTPRTVALWSGFPLMNDFAIPPFFYIQYGVWKIFSD